MKISIIEVATNQSNLQSIIWNCFQSIIKIGTCAFFNVYTYHYNSQNSVTYKAQIS